MEENRWWGALGLTPPEDTGAQAQEVADPAESTEEKGGSEQEVTEPAESVTDTVDNGAEVSTQTAPDETGEGKKKPAREQSAEERHRQAAQRREKERREQELRVREEEAQKAAQQVKSIFASLGLKDGAGNAIETVEQFEAMQSEQRAAKIKKDLRAGIVTPEALRAAVLEAPEVKAVLEKAQQTTREAEEARNKANRESYAAGMQQELEAIRKLDPSIQSVDDIIRRESGPEYARYVRQGLKPSEAFRLANFDAIRDRDRNAAEQAARNAAAGKSHVQATPTAGRQPLAVPEDYKRNMRRFIKGISDEEIARYYHKYNKK